MKESLPKKALGQHWLNDEKTLADIVESASLLAGDTVLEIGPGLGSLTKQLVKKVQKVIAVEFDDSLAAQLPQRLQAKNLEVFNQDILEFDLSSLPAGYKVVANIPYYITGHLLRQFSETTHPPAKAVLLVQKEVAQRINAAPGNMSLLSVSLQLHYEVGLGNLIPAQLFTPPPKVDSQLVILKHRQQPLFDNVDMQKFFQIVKAGFAGKRKKLRGSLAAGLHISKDQADTLLQSAGVDGNLRAQNLTLEDWHRLYQANN